MERPAREIDPQPEPPPRRSRESTLPALGPVGPTSAAHTLAHGDIGSKARMLLGMQRGAGNAAVARLLARQHDHTHHEDDPTLEWSEFEAAAPAASKFDAATSSGFEYELPAGPARGRAGRHQVEGARPVRPGDARHRQGVHGPDEVVGQGGPCHRRAAGPRAGPLRHLQRDRGEDRDRDGGDADLQGRRQLVHEVQQERGARTPRSPTGTSGRARPTRARSTRRA